MTPEEARELLRKFKSGQCTDRELEIINAWYDSISADNDLTLLHDDINLADVKNSMYNVISNKIEEEDGTAKVRTISWSNFIKVAAVLVLAIGFIFILYKSRQKSITTDNQIARIITERTIVASNKIVLADGTKVWLKEGSKLDYPATFKGNVREVTLKGEAFFEVQRDVHKPFIIHSGKIQTKVLGTSFNIRAYESDNEAEVTVVTGKVSVALNESNSSKFREVILQPNQKVTYLKEFNKLVRLDERNATRYKMVAKNEMVFNEASMKDILSTISLAYKIDIVLENDKIENCVITADLTDQTLDTTLKILTRSIGANYTTKENKILISGKGCENY